MATINPVLNSLEASIQSKDAEEWKNIPSTIREAFLSMSDQLSQCQRQIKAMSNFASNVDDISAGQRRLSARLDNLAHDSRVIAERTAVAVDERFSSLSSSIQQKADMSFVSDALMSKMNKSHDQSSDNDRSASSALWTRVDDLSGRLLATEIQMEELSNKANHQKQRNSEDESNAARMKRIEKQQRNYGQLQILLHDKAGKNSVSHALHAKANKEQVASSMQSFDDRLVALDRSQQAHSKELNARLQALSFAVQTLTARSQQTKTVSVDNKSSAKERDEALGRLLALVREREQQREQELEIARQGNNEKNNNNDTTRFADKCRESIERLKLVVETTQRRQVKLASEVEAMRSFRKEARSILVKVADSAKEQAVKVVNEALDGQIKQLISGHMERQQEDQARYEKEQLDQQNQQRDLIQSALERTGLVVNMVDRVQAQTQDLTLQTTGLELRMGALINDVRRINTADRQTHSIDNITASSCARLLGAHDEHAMNSNDPRNHLGCSSPLRSERQAHAAATSPMMPSPMVPSSAVNSSKTNKTLTSELGTRDSGSEVVKAARRRSTSTVRVGHRQRVVAGTTRTTASKT